MRSGLFSGAASYQHRSVHSIEAAHSGALEARGVDASTVKSIEAGRDRGAALQRGAGQRPQIISESSFDGARGNGRKSF